MDRTDHWCTCVSSVLQMIENQEELRVSKEKIRGLEEELRVLQHQKSELEGRQISGPAEGSLQPQELHNQA